MGRLQPFVGSVFRRGGDYFVRHSRGHAVLEVAGPFGEELEAFDAAGRHGQPIPMPRDWMDPMGRHPAVRQVLSWRD